MAGKAIAVSEVRLSGGPAIKSGVPFPWAGAGVPAEAGSLYICQNDGSWWQKLDDGDDTAWETVRFVNGPNGSLSTLELGMPVVQIGGSLYPASAASTGTAHVIGLVALGAGPTLIARITASGPLRFQVPDWTLITGELGGLTLGATYYLASVPGMLTTTPPAAPGQSLVEVGQAMTTTRLLINIRRPIFL